MQDVQDVQDVQDKTVGDDEVPKFQWCAEI